MTRSGQGQPHNANVTSGEGDILQEAIVREEEAAALDRDLKVKVRAKQGAIAKDLRSAAQRALDGDRVARERKATRDRML